MYLLLNLIILNSIDMTKVEQLKDQIKRLKAKQCETEWEHEQILEQIEQIEEEIFLIEEQ